MQTTVYDAEFCVDSEFDIKNIITYRNLELLSKNRFFIFVEFSVSVAASENEICQKLFHIQNLQVNYDRDIKIQTSGSVETGKIRCMCSKNGASGIMFLLLQ